MELANQGKGNWRGKCGWVDLFEFKFNIGKIALIIRRSHKYPWHFLFILNESRVDWGETCG